MESPAQVVLSSEWTSAPTALQARMQRLQSRVEECRRSAQEQDGSVREVCRGALKLQAQAAALKARLEDMGRRLQELGVGVAAAAAPPPAPQPAAPELPVVAAAPEGPSPAAGRSPLQCLPYILIVAGGIGYGWTSHAVEPSPPVSVPASVLPAAPAPAESPESEALGLVYEYRLPGTEQSMLELIGSQEDVLGPSPWDVSCGDDLRCDVSYTPSLPAQAEPLYGFSVDLGAGTVTPSAETVVGLDRGRNRG